MKKLERLFSIVIVPFPGGFSQFLYLFGGLGLWIGEGDVVVVCAFYDLNE
jgi:hypothetical protein